MPKNQTSLSEPQASLHRPPIFILVLQFRFLIARQRAQQAERDIVLPFLSVRLSVCLSASIVSKRIHVVTLSFFWQSDRGIILVFFIAQSLLQTSSRNRFSGGAKYPGWENFAAFNRNRRLSRKRYEIGQWLLLITDRKS